MRRPAIGIRARTTLVASLMVGVAVVLGVAILLFMMTHALRSSIESAASTRAGDVALIAQSGSLPTTLPGHGDSLLVQVVRAGHVVSSSRDLEGRPSIVPQELRPGQTSSQQLPSLHDLDNRVEKDIDVDPNTAFLVISRGVETTRGPATIIVASSLSPLEDTMGILAPLLLLSAPIALAIVAIVTWLLTGMALRPVSAMRARAETISSSSSGERLPLPPTHDEIRGLAETMNGMLQRIEASNAAQRSFVSDASHELKSPITAIRTMLEVARANSDAIDTAALLEDLATEGDRLELLVADLLLLATSDEEGLRISTSHLDLAETVSSEVTSVGSRTHKVIYFAPECAPTIEADEARFRQLLRNLLDNAVRHARRQVWVAIECEECSAIIAVSDDGTGIPDEDRERVFERFVRIDEGRGRGDGGTGLGLSVSRAIAEAHGWSIGVGAPRSGGATFEVAIPGLHRTGRDDRLSGGHAR